MASAHLDAIIERKESAANLLVMFADIVAYSRRRTVAQKVVIDAFTECLQEAIDEAAAENLTYLQKNNVNFLTDVIRIPTGDGAAVGFSFEGLHEVHLTLALKLLAKVHDRNKRNACEVFAKQAWCNCHDSHHVRIGIADGKTVIFRDLNGNYNAAGTALNLAARAMGVADASQVLLTGDAYEHIIDMAEDPRLNERFVEHPAVPIKHGATLKVYQYTDERHPNVDASTPRDVKKLRALDAIGGMVGGPDFSRIASMNDEDMLSLLQNMGEASRLMRAVATDAVVESRGMPARDARTIESEVAGEE
jgi:class 3 adenylate cyclase